MGNKLPPPLLEGTLPAFYITEQGMSLDIPFSMNRAVGVAQVDGFRIKIKTIQSGEELVTIDINTNLNHILQNLKISLVNSEPENWGKLRVGQFYKIQLAYINQDTLGFYSTVGVAKCTAKPTASIKGLEYGGASNAHLYQYTGIYDHKDDITEFAYSYCFNLYSNDKTLLYTSNELLHNTDEDDITESQDSYIFPQDLDVGLAYYIQYEITTINSLKVFSPLYRITQKPSVNPEMEATLHAELNYEEGYVNLYLKSDYDDINHIKLITGSFSITRSSEESNYSVWEQIYKFQLTASTPNLNLFKDFTVEQGKNYKYSVQQYNDYGLYSNRIISTSVYVDFEHAFLYDGERQLKIKYNPKVSSFKRNVLETKVDTIGGKYPFIFRNANVNYGEFPISGLISYLMDEEHLFLNEKDYSLTEKTTNLISDNISSERIFKMKVLEWLTNGKPKIFRSPSEGNYIVRLMNSSLTPNDTLGRMLHTFSCTAYEVADFNYETLVDMNFIKLQNDIRNHSYQWHTISFTYKEGNQIKYVQPDQQLNIYPAKTVRFDNMYPGDQVQLIFEDGTEEIIVIGATGSYYLDTGVNITSISLKNTSTGSMTYSFIYQRPNVFNTIDNVEIIEVAGRQFIGENDILRSILYVYNEDTKEWLRNPKLNLANFYYLNAEKIPLLSGDNIEDYNPSFELDGQIIDINEAENITYTNLKAPTKLISNKDVVINIGYQLCNIDFLIENQKNLDQISDSGHYLYPLKQAKKEYLKAVNSLKEFYGQIETQNINAWIKDKNFKTIDEAQQSLITQVQNTYTTYILTLIEAQKEDTKRGGK